MFQRKENIWSTILYFIEYPYPRVILLFASFFSVPSYPITISISLLSYLVLYLVCRELP